MEICIDSEEQNGNLHFIPKGEFTPDTALELTSLMKAKYNGKGDIVVNTSHITEVEPLSKQMFSIMLGYHDLPKDKVYLKGNKGQEICHDEGNVIEATTKKHGGCGRCRNCTCGHKKPH